MKKRLLSILLMSVLLFACLCSVACGEKETPIDKDKYGERARTFTFCYYVGGYGSDWLTAVTDDYMLNVNTEVYIDLKRNTNNETTRENIRAGIGAYDLYQIEVDMFNFQNQLEDLTDLYEMEVYGEPGVKVKDKFGDRWVDYYEESGHWYQMPQTVTTGWNWAYNEDMLNKTFGEGKWSLPKTTDEMFAFGDELYKKGVYFSAFPGADTAGGDYSRYAYEVWFAQLTGFEGYNNYMKGYYTDEATGELKFAESDPIQIKQNATAITEAYKIASKLSSQAATASDPQYMHAQSMGMTFKDVDVMIYGGKYRGQKVAPIAFAYIGGWLETEVAPFVNAGTIDGNQTVKVMKMPVASAIINRTHSINDDATLSKVIDYVDGVSETKPAGVTDEDVAIVKEARNMTSELICRQFVIRKNANCVDDIKDFLAYLTSDRAQKIAAKATRGISVLPYGYEPTEEDMGFEISPYTKSLKEIGKDAVIIDIGGLDNPYKSFFSISWYIDSTAAGGTLSQNLFTGQAESADTIADSTYRKIASTYKDLMVLYKAKYGIA